MSELVEYQVSNGVEHQEILIAALQAGLKLLRPDDIDWFERDFIRDDMVRWPAVAIEAAERLQAMSSRKRTDGYQQIRVTRGITADVLADLAEVGPYSISGQVWAFGHAEVADFSDDADMVAFTFDRDQFRAWQLQVPGLRVWVVPSRIPWAKRVFRKR